MRRFSLAVVLLVGSSALAQQAAPVFRGSWTASAGARVLAGSWTGQVERGRPNAARGTWTLVGGTGSVLLEGTWSAQKTVQGWQGTWSARTRDGRSLSGRWTAGMAGLGGKTFEDLLKRTAEREIGGFWQSGGSQGDWWLRSSPPQEQRQ